MERKRNVFSRYPLPLFFLLAYLFSWWSVPFADGAILPHGPLLSAFLVIALGEGREGLRKWWSRLTNWRGGLWYLIGPAIILSYLLVAFLINLLLGATPTSPFRLPGPAVWIQLLLLGGLWEEPGWTGYALPRLQQQFEHQKHGPLIAALILAVFRAIWHIPLLLQGTLPWFDVFIFSLFFQLIITWIYNRSRGSVPAVMVFHYFNNVVAGGIMLQVFSGGEKMTFWILFTICAGLAGLVILLLGGTSLGYRTLRAGEQTLSTRPSG